MEIIDYLKAAKRRLWVIVAVPVIAAVAAAAVVLTAPQQYAATAYVAAPALIGGAGSQYTGTQATNQFVAAFEAATTAPKVLNQVTADTGVAQNVLRSGLTVTQVGASSQLEVRYQSTKQSTVAPVLADVTKQALSFLFSTQVDIASGQVRTDTASVTAATTAISDWEKSTKVSQPDKLYQATLDEISTLRKQQLQMQAIGNSRAANAAAAAITADQKTLDTLGPLLPEYQTLLSARDAATSALEKAQSALQDAQAQAQAADPAKVTSIGTPHQVSRKRQLVSTVAPIAGAGLLLGVLLFAALELLAGRRRATAPVSPASAPASDGLTSATV